MILHNILPEGAEIPANRGQLALLVWNTAGRPEPVNTPAFADVADADTAKAAQWCVEQGIMEAKTAETFKPEGWMPKFKTIEVWERHSQNSKPMRNQREQLRLLSFCMQRGPLLTNC